MKKRSHANISTIARKLGVSSVTVSKALRGHPDISPETTSKIKKVAMELGYVPNLMARNLSARNSRAIGVIVPKLAHFFFSKTIEAIYDAAFQNKYEILLTVSQENAEREAIHLQMLLAMRVDGLIISVSQETQSPAVFKAALDRGVPITFMDRSMRVKGTNTVVADDYGGAFSATAHAIKVGYRTLGHIGGPQQLNIGRERFRGFRDALQEHHIPFSPDHVVFGGFGEADGYNGLLALYHTGHLPEFIFAASFPVTLGVLCAAKELGLRVTHDFDMISFGSGGFNEMLSPSITIVEQPTATLGKAAFELTLEHITKGDSFKPRHLKLPTRLVMGETCRGRLAHADRPVPNGGNPSPGGRAHGATAEVGTAGDGSVS